MTKLDDLFGSMVKSFLGKSFAVKISQNPRPLLNDNAVFVKSVEEQLFREADSVEAVQISPRILRLCG